MGAACSRNLDSRRTACVVTPDNGACGVGGVFFEPEGTIATEQWEYVGEGNGGYNKMQKYDYVGHGRGSFDRENTRRDRQSKRCCVGLLLLLIAAAVCSAVFVLTPGAFDEAREQFASIVAGLSGPVVTTNSSAGTQRSRQQPVEILTASTAAPTVVPVSITIPPPPVTPAAVPATVASVPAAVVPATIPATVTSVPAPVASASSQTPGQASTPAPPPVAVKYTPSEHLFSCAVGEEGDKFAAMVGAEWVATDVDKDSRVTLDELEAQKKTLSKETFDQLIAADGDQDGSLDRGEFAAVFAKLDKPLQSEKVTEEIATWSAAKQTWCCQHAGLGCTTTATVTQTTTVTSTTTTITQLAAQYPSRDPYDCNGNAFIDWSLAHATWCCSVHQKGCPENQAPHTPAVTANCDTLCEFESMQASCKSRIQWSATNTHKGKDDACAAALQEVIVHCPDCSSCALEEADCPSATVPPLYDCDDGLDHAESWPVAKQSWCCGKTGKGCPPDVAAPSPYECDEAKLKTWSEVESAWCCTHKSIGCPAGSTAGSEPGFNCDSGLQSWSWGWSDQKKAWCCQHENKGCGGTSAPAAA